MGYELSYDIIAINRFSGVFEDMEKTLQKMQQCVATLNLSVEQLSESLAQAGSSASEHFKGFDAHFGDGIAGHILNMGSAALVGADQMDAYAKSLHLAFAHNNDSDNILKILQQFSSQNPFDMQSLVDATTALGKARMPIQNILPTLQQLGNIAAGSNGNLEKLAETYAHIGNHAMTGLDLKQFAADGIPASVLQKYKGQSATSMLASLGGQGGIYSGAMDKKMNEFVPSMEALARSFGYMSATFGELLNKDLHIVPLLHDMAKEMDAITDRMKKMADAFPMATNILLFTGALGTSTIALRALCAVGSKAGDFLQLGSMISSAAKLGGVLRYLGGLNMKDLWFWVKLIGSVQCDGLMAMAGSAGGLLATLGGIALGIAAVVSATYLMYKAFQALIHPIETFYALRDLLGDMCYTVVHFLDLLKKIPAVTKGISLFGTIANSIAAHLAPGPALDTTSLAGPGVAARQQVHTSSSYKGRLEIVAQPGVVHRLLEEKIGNPNFDVGINGVY